MPTMHNLLLGMDDLEFLGIPLQMFFTIFFKSKLLGNLVETTSLVSSEFPKPKPIKT